MKMTVDELRLAVKEAAECDSCKNPTAHLDNTKHFHDVKLLVEYIDTLEVELAEMTDNERVSSELFEAASESIADYQEQLKAKSHHSQLANQEGEAK